MVTDGGDNTIGAITVTDDNSLCLHCVSTHITELEWGFHFHNHYKYQIVLSKMENAFDLKTFMKLSGNDAPEGFPF